MFNEIMKRIFYTILLFFSILCISCEKKTEPSTSIEKKTFIYGYAVNKITNAPIQGVLITLMPNIENRYTGSDGTFQFNNISTPGDYTLTADIEGFKPGERKNIHIVDETPIEVTFVLEPTK